ncbi:hypothetical protein [Pseudalkalibacillus sp. SCS-8]|uniref:hypothetical protein n=1 Tax=Pseudalkalibacillus nanhaiensis TaxID=3115291 RepID=UPI0032DA6E8D
MHWEPLPNWFWLIYYFLLFATLGTAIVNVAKKKVMFLSVVAILFTVTIPIISLINSIGRAEGINEFEHFVSQLQQGAVWSIFTIIGYLFLLLWWAFLLYKNVKKQPHGCF